MCTLNRWKSLIRDDLVRNFSMIVDTREFWQRGIVAVVYLLSSIYVLDVLCILLHKKALVRYTKERNLPG